MVLSGCLLKFEIGKKQSAQRAGGRAWALSSRNLAHGARGFVRAFARVVGKLSGLSWDSLSCAAWRAACYNALHSPASEQGTAARRPNNRPNSTPTHRTSAYLPPTERPASARELRELSHRDPPGANPNDSNDPRCRSNVTGAWPSDDIRAPLRRVSVALCPGSR